MSESEKDLEVKATTNSSRGRGSKTEWCHNNEVSDLSNQPSHKSKTSVDVLVESKWKALETQVGGHTFKDKQFGIMDVGDGLILKSLQDPPRGTRELNFYQDIFYASSDDPDLLLVKEFLPSFYGTEKRDNATFLKLKNLTSEFTHPCVADLKMGRVTFDQEASPAKIEHEKAKYPPMEDLGFAITGMMIYDPATHTNEKYTKEFSRSLTKENVGTEGLGRFFGFHKGHLRKDAIHPIISKLKMLELWFLKQKKYSFIASSLLLVYEGSENANVKSGTGRCTWHETISNISSNKHCERKVGDTGALHSEDFSLSLPEGACNGAEDAPSAQKKLKTSISLIGSGCSLSLEKKKKIADVHLIDFAHVFPANDVDSNFLFGLQRLITLLQQLLMT